MPVAFVFVGGGSVVASGGPVIEGYEFRRPTTRDETDEPVRSVVTLATGATRSYDKGIRRVYSLTWAKFTEAEVDQLRTLVAAPYVTYKRDVSSAGVVVSTEDGLSVSPIAGTFPVRYAVSLTLRDRDLR